MLTMPVLSHQQNYENINNSGKYEWLNSGSQDLKLIKEELMLPDEENSTDDIHTRDGFVESPCHLSPDPDLTSLNWLHNLDIMGHLAVPGPPTPPDSPVLGTEKLKINKGHKVSQPVLEPVPVEEIDYTTNGDIKPPYSYATLICMAMNANKNKMTLSAIYKWIRENFLYYKNADPSWQNSIRHNLSLNKCFIKIPRSKDEPGKGGFWRLDPTYGDHSTDGFFKKRRCNTANGSTHQRNPTTKRRNRTKTRPIPTTFTTSTTLPSLLPIPYVTNPHIPSINLPYLQSATTDCSLTVELSPLSLNMEENEILAGNSESSNDASWLPTDTNNTNDWLKYAQENGSFTITTYNNANNSINNFYPNPENVSPTIQTDPLWDENKALSLLDPSLDFDGLIDLDNL